jgi:hypothetical protein
LETVAQKLAETCEPGLEGSRRIRRIIKNLFDDTIVNQFTLQNTGKEKDCLKN